MCARARVRVCISVCVWHSVRPCVLVCVCVRERVWHCVRTHVSVCVCARTRTHGRAHGHARLCVCARACACVCARVCVHVCVCLCEEPRGRVCIVPRIVGLGPMHGQRENHARTVCAPRVAEKIEVDESAKLVPARSCSTNRAVPCHDFEFSSKQYRPKTVLVSEI